MAEIFQRALNMSIAASWLILAVVALRLLLRRAPKRLLLLLWGLVLLRLALPVSIESALSLIPSAQTLPEGIMLNAEPELNTGIAALNSAINPAFTAAFSPTPAASANPLQVLLPIASVLWLAGAAAMLLWALVCWLRLSLRVRSAVRIEGNIYECEAAQSPFVLGLFRPRIYLPFGLEDGARELVLAHERAHISRGDHITKPLGWLVLAAHWYNPLVWLAYALFCRDLELACDERVVRGMTVSGRADYSQALLDLSRPRKLVSVCPLAFGESSVKCRVKSVLTYKKPAFWIILLAVVICIGAAVCFLTDPKTEDESETGTTDAVTVTSALTENCPSQVLDYAVACVEQLMEQMEYLGVKSAEITGLECCAETESPEGETLLLFKLGARYELAEPESVMPAGGMEIDNGWLTVTDSGGDRFMLLLKNDEDWSYIGLVTQQTLSEYGADYEAAALGEYARYLAQQPEIEVGAAEGLAESVPEAVLEAAKARVLAQAEELDAFDISAAEVMGLELCAETACPDGGTLYLYGLVARYKCEGISEKMPAGGTVAYGGKTVNIYTDGDWFSLLLHGLPTDYLLLLSEDEDWEWLGTLDRNTLYTEYNGSGDTAALRVYELLSRQSPDIRLAEDLEGLPEQLIDYACSCALTQAEVSAFDISQVEISALEPSAEFEGPEGGMLCLYRLGLRYRLAEPDDVILVGGIEIEDGWLTRLDSGGDRFMLLRRDGEELSYIGVLSELTVVEFGGDYEAAALDLYERVLAGGVTWSSNLAMSSANAIEFKFDFELDLAQTRMDFSCSDGTIASNVSSLTWSPDPDTAFATVYFTITDMTGGDREVAYSGSIHITRIARPSTISATYLAQLDCQGLVMEPSKYNGGAVIRTSE